MRITTISILAVFILWSCSEKSSDVGSTLLGKWQAKWETNPASFPEVNDVKSYTMNGEIIFYPDSVEINAFGFPGCIFSSDTLSHSLKWVISNDTLSFLNEDDIYGMSYKIKEMNESEVTLQLMEDIFLTLKK